MGVRPLVRCLGAGLVLVLLPACGGGEGTTPDVVSVTFTRTEQGREIGAGTVTDGAALGRFATILSDGDPAAFGGRGAGPCRPAMRTSEVRYVLADGEARELTVPGCERGPAGDALDALLEEWVATPPPG